MGVGEELDVEGEPAGVDKGEYLLEDLFPEGLKAGLRVTEREVEEDLQDQGVDLAHHLPRKGVFESGIGMIFRADYHIGALVPHDPQDPVELFRVEVEVGVEEYHEVSGGVVETLLEGVTLAPVFRDAYGHRASELGGGPPCLLVGVVAASVIDEDDLVAAPGPS